jgi:hypothetical protein
MKHKFVGVLGLLAMAMIIALPQVQAQSRLVANVPFNFEVGQKAMASGQYEILSLSQQAGELRNLNTDAAEVFIKAMRVQASNGGHARLVFNKYGNQYFLSEIWDGESNTGIQLSQSQHEKEIRLAGNRVSDGPETVIVAMR